MPKLLSFLEKSVQWVALGIASVFLLLCVYWYVLTPAAIAKVGGKPVGPGDIDELTRDTAVAPIANDIRVSSAEAVKPPDVIGPWKRAMTNAKPIEIIASALNTRTERSHLGPAEPGGPTSDLLITAVATLPKATPVSVQAGLSVAAPPKGPNGQDVAGAVASDILWASAAFYISAQDLKTAFGKPLEKKDPNYAKFYRTAFLSIELQRQQSIGHDATGTPVFPNDDSFKVVEVPRINQQEMQALPDAKSSRDTKNAFAQWADANEMNIRQPKFYTITAGSPYAPAVLLGQAPAPAAGAPVLPAAIIRPAPAASVPPLIPAPAGAGGNAQQQAGIDPLTLATDQLVWAHDDTVEAGRSYRYRVVYHMKNPVFTLENIADPKILDQLAISSPPSAWSGPVTIPTNVQYWVTALPRNGTAQVDYFKWEAGSWKYTKNMSLSAGDTVPGTDQTIVDIHNAPSPRPKEQYVLLTDSFGEPIRHIPKDDRDDPAFKQRQKDANPDAAKAAAGGAAPAATPPRPGTPAPRGNR